MDFFEEKYMGKCPKFIKRIQNFSLKWNFESKEGVEGSTKPANHPLNPPLHRYT